MSTNERPHEKRTGDEPAPDEPSLDQQTMPEDSPAHSEPLPNDCEPDPDHPPQTRLLVTGFSREEVTADFLIGIHDFAEEHGLDVESISVGQPDE